jgi:hypothetical protein
MRRLELGDVVSKADGAYHYVHATDMVTARGRLGNMIPAVVPQALAIFSLTGMLAQAQSADPSKQKLEPQLHNTWVTRVGDAAEIVVAQRGVRIVQQRMVERVEQLHAELRF